MNTLKIIPGGSPQEAREAYKTWWGQQQGIQIVGTPELVSEGTGWIVKVWHRPASPMRPATDE